jgi:hypothetical protein
VVPSHESSKSSTLLKWKAHLNRSEDHVILYRGCIIYMEVSITFQFLVKCYNELYLGGMALV